MIGLIGSQHFSDNLIKELENCIDIKLVTTNLRDPRLAQKAEDCEIIHYIYSPLVTLGGLGTVKALKKMKKKIIVHWIGTDILNATTKCKSRFIARRYKHLVDVHLAHSSRMVKELGTINISCRELPLPNFNLYKPRELPPSKNVLIYLPDSAEDFFGKNIIDTIIDSFPDVHFMILPNSGNNYSNKPNVTCVSWAKDMEKIYVDTRVFIRLPIHDGLPSSIIEALSMGRYVIYSHDFPHCEHAASAEEVIMKLPKLLESSSANIEGSNYVHGKYDKNELKRQLIELYRSL